MNKAEVAALVAECHGALPDFLKQPEQKTRGAFQLGLDVRAALPASLAPSAQDKAMQIAEAEIARLMGTLPPEDVAPAKPRPAPSQSSVQPDHTAALTALLSGYFEGTSDGSTEAANFKARRATIALSKYLNRHFPSYKFWTRGTRKKLWSQGVALIIELRADDITEAG